MAFLTGLVLVDAPASALNNAGAAEEARTENAVAVKYIRTSRGRFLTFRHRLSGSGCEARWSRHRNSGGNLPRSSEKRKSPTQMRTLSNGGMTICSDTCAPRPRRQAPRRSGRRTQLARRRHPQARKSLASRLSVSAHWSRLAPCQSPPISVPCRVMRVTPFLTSISSTGRS